jgi:maleate isomerase
MVPPPCWAERRVFRPGAADGIEGGRPVSGDTRRIGLIVPSSNTTMETEVPAILGGRPGDEHFTFHSSRMRMRNVTPDELRRMNEQTDRAAAELADARPHAVATACLVAIMAQGSGYHCTAQDQISAVLEAEGAPAPVVSSAGALIDALGELGARRVAMVTPYAKPLTKLVADYIAAAGIEVHDTVSLEVSDNRAVAALDPADLKDHWRRLDLTGCDALVLSACVQMPSLPVLEAVEQDAGLPTLSAATATAWSLLRALELDPAAPGAGSLLAGQPARA